MYLCRKYVKLPSWKSLFSYSFYKKELLFIVSYLTNLFTRPIFGLQRWNRSFLILSCFLCESELLALFAHFFALEKGLIFLISAYIQNSRKKCLMHLWKKCCTLSVWQEKVSPSKVFTRTHSFSVLVNL